MRAYQDTPDTSARALGRAVTPVGRPRPLGLAEGARPRAAATAPRARRRPPRAAQARGGRLMGKVLLAAPRSFCAGVDRAIEIVERLLEQHGPPIYVRHHDRPQRPRRPPARGTRRGVRRVRGRGPAGCDLRPLGARRRAGRAGELRAPRAAGRRRGLPARLEGARRGAPLRRQRPPRRARRPPPPRRGGRDDGRAARTRPSSSSRRRRRARSRRTASPSR